MKTIDLKVFFDTPPALLTLADLRKFNMFNTMTSMYLDDDLKFHFDPIRTDWIQS